MAISLFICQKSKAVIRKTSLKSKNNIEFLDATTNEAIQYYLSKNYDVAALNHANSFTPGGGYKKGSMAQEEDICMSSPFFYAALDVAAKKGFYKTWGKDWNSQVLYTPNAPFIREESKKNYKILSASYKASIITAAAPDFRKITNSKEIPKNSEYENLIKQIYYAPIVVKEGKINLKCTSKIDKIPKPQVLIVGALGCGAFRFKETFKRDNHEYTYSEFMAERFVEVLSNLGGHYKKICFAIPKSLDKNNYDTFKKKFIENEKNFKSVSF